MVAVPLATIAETKQVLVLDACAGAVMMTEVLLCNAIPYSGVPAVGIAATSVTLVPIRIKTSPPLLWIRNWVDGLSANTATVLATVLALILVVFPLD